MTYNSIDDPDFIYATDEQFKGYCDLDLTNSQWHMAHVVAKKIPFREFQNVKNRYRKKGYPYSDDIVIEDLYDDVRQYHLENDPSEPWLPASQLILEKI